MRILASVLSRHRLRGAVAVLLGVLLAGCSLLTPEPTPTATPPPTSTPTPTRSATPTLTPSITPTPTTTPTPTITPTPTPLAAIDIFNQISPSIVLVDIPDVQLGSGVLIDGGYIVTNAHVVWPNRAARIVFPDGSEFTDVPVVGWDLLVDLAVLGPVETDAAPLALADGESLDVASDVYLLGYPGERESFPEPTIVRGLISRVREWDPVGITYFQTDAAVAGGQSGGVMVSDMGAVIGISGFRFTEANYGLVASTADLKERVAALIAGEVLASPGERDLFANPVGLDHEFDLANSWDAAVYVFDEPVGARIEFSVTSGANLSIEVVDSFGEFLDFADDDLAGEESLTFGVRNPGPVFVKVFQYGQFSVTGSASANVPMYFYDDPDNGARTSVGGSHYGNFDHPYDVDYFVQFLTAGEEITVDVGSVLSNPFLTVDFLDARGRDQVADDNSGSGLFGYDVQLTYRAPATGRYLFVVENRSLTRFGGYVISFNEPYESAPTPVSPPPSPTPVDSSLGTFRGFESAALNVGLQVPAEWVDDSRDCPFQTCYSSADGDVLILAELDGFAASSPERLADQLVDEFSDTGTVRIESEDDLLSDAGLPYYRLIFTTTSADGFRAEMYVLVYEDPVGGYLLMWYILQPGNSADLRPVIEYTFRSLEQLR